MGQKDSWFSPSNKTYTSCKASLFLLLTPRDMPPGPEALKILFLSLTLPAHQILWIHL